MQYISLTFTVSPAKGALVKILYLFFSPTDPVSPFKPVLQVAAGEEAADRPVARVAESEAVATALRSIADMGVLLLPEIPVLSIKIGHGRGRVMNGRQQLRRRTEDQADIIGRDPLLATAAAILLLFRSTPERAERARFLL